MNANAGPLPIDALVSLTREGAEPLPSLPDGSQVVFPDGDRLRAIIGTTDDANLTILPPALGDAALAIPRSSLLGLLLAPPVEPEALSKLCGRVRDEPRDADVLHLANGDRLAGDLIALTPERIEFQTDAAAADLTRSSVLAFAAGPPPAVYPRPEGPYLELTFTDGSRLGVVAARLEQGRIRAKTRFGVEIAPELTAVARIHGLGPRITYLSEREPDAVQYVGYLGRHPNAFGRNATWDGHRLRLAGEPYDRGLGALPRTLLAYRLDGAKQRFQALVGLDDRAGPLASVVFRVLVDGAERFASPPMGRSTRPITVDLDLAGGKLLILATEFGERGDVQDSADWAEARLVR